MADSELAPGGAFDITPDSLGLDLDFSSPPGGTDSRSSAEPFSVPNQRSQVRFPRGRVIVNGEEIPFERFEVILNANQAGDTFDILAPLFDPDSPYDWVWWSETVDIVVEISVGFADSLNGAVSDWTQLIVGPVDAVAVAPLTFGPHSSLAMRARTAIGSGGMLPRENGPPHPVGAALQVRGRDYTGQMMQSEVSTVVTGAEVTSKDVINGIASKIPGLSTDLSALPDDPVGEEFAGVQGRNFLHRPAWDVISAIAEHENLRADMVGTTLRLAPRQVDTGSPYQIFYVPAKRGSGTEEFVGPSSNCKTLRMARELSLGRGTEHFIEGYDASTGRRPSRAVARTSGSGSAFPPLSYRMNIPGITQEEAERDALARALQTSSFERVIEFMAPGDPRLTLETPVELSGTGTAFDQSYRVDQISHFFELSRGYEMEVRAKAADSQTKTEVGPPEKFYPQIFELPAIPHVDITPPSGGGSGIFTLGLSQVGGGDVLGGN